MKGRLVLRHPEEMPNYLKESANILADWSDSEEYNRDGVLVDEDTWTPKPETVVKLYAEIAEKKVLELKWKPKGRRKPADSSQVSAQGDQPQIEQTAQPEAMDFDEEEESTPQLRPIGKGTPRGTQKKKPVTLDSILSNMVRHKIIEQQAVDNEVSGSTSGATGNQGISNDPTTLQGHPPSN